MTLHDLTHVHYPQTQPTKRLREIERRLPEALQRSAAILVDSDFIAQEARHHYKLPADKLHVAPLGYDRRFSPRSADQLAQCLQRFNLQWQQYFICLGTLEPRKNLELAIAAHQKLPRSVRQQCPLVMVGSKGWGHLPERLTQSMQHDPCIQQLGYQSETTVAELLAGATALLFPSYYEGFGLPVLEAMASGTPVIATEAGAVLEVAASAALYTAAEDVVTYSEHMYALVDNPDLQQQCRSRGLERAAHYSWARCADVTVKAYQQAGRL
jgi:alpha-1,3-rhamnosyl/mannosyltransferase